jgi:Fe-S-cluster containining protein
VYPEHVPRVFALSIHADYRCRHSGVCCSSDWDVPVEAAVYRNLEEALRAARVVPSGDAHDGGAPLIVEEGMPDDAAAMIARTESGHCVFYQRPTGLCGVHHQLGHDALPMTCRHFPRLAVRDRRGTHISLSHYCPTAASLLFRDVAIQIVADPPAFPPADYEGLVVDDDEWPPLLHGRMLMDHEGYGAWERHMVMRCASETRSVEQVVATLRRDALLLRDFDPLRERLLERIAGLPSSLVLAEAPLTLESSRQHLARVMETVPADLRPASDEQDLERAYVELVRPGWGDCQMPLKRYIAAKAFANWTAYQGRGLTAIVNGLDAALALVRVEAARRCRDSRAAVDHDHLREAIRAADFALNHLAVGEDLAASWSIDDAGVAV